MNSWVLSFLQTAVTFLGGLDQVILNHGVVPPLAYWDDSKQNFHQLDHAMDVNFRSHARLAAHSLRHLEASGGSIGVVNSVSGEFQLS